MTNARVTFLRSAGDGCYEAHRAAALSGVPRTTVYWWARHNVVVPSVSPVQEKLWSYSDLMALRIVSWLRRPKDGADGSAMPSSPMPQVRQALRMIAQLDLDLWSPHQSGYSPLLVDRAGRIYVDGPDGVIDLRGQRALVEGDALRLTAPFEFDGHRGPDLLSPRPLLRIVPSKLTGEPHIVGSRVTTQTVAALAARNYSVSAIARMYEQSELAIGQAVELEQQLAVA